MAELTAVTFFTFSLRSSYSLGGELSRVSLPTFDAIAFWERKPASLEVLGL